MCQSIVLTKVVPSAVNVNCGFINEIFIERARPGNGGKSDLSHVRYISKGHQVKKQGIQYPSLIIVR